MSGGSSLFAGRLGLAGARIPHVDRHGLLWLSKGNVYVEDGTLHFRTAGTDEIAPGVYAIPSQTISMILLGPGTTVSHDVLRILARHGTLLAAVGEGGVKFYTAPPMGQGRSSVARAHARLWADEEARLYTARRMYAYRFREVLPHRDITVLRGIEGARIRQSYGILADKYGIKWEGRRYDRNNPNDADLPNQAINHAATFVEAAADIAVAAVGALPPLGFIHEDSSNAFTLDIADLWRIDITIPLAFSVASRCLKSPSLSLEREVRLEAARWFRKHKLVHSMIDRVKELLNVDDSSSDS
jgi:CRISPR-associated protein Cas1